MVTAIAIAPDGAWLTTTGIDESVRIWDAVTGQARATLDGHGWIRRMAVAPGGAWLATVADDRAVRIWDTASWQARAMMRVENSIIACAWLGDTGLAVGGEVSLYLFDFLSDAP